MTFAKKLEVNPEYIFILMSFENCKNEDITTFYSYIQKAIYNQLVNRLESVKCRDLKVVQDFLATHRLTNPGFFWN